MPKLIGLGRLYRELSTMELLTVTLELTAKLCYGSIEQLKMLKIKEGHGRCSLCRETMKRNIGWFCP